jgi:hypothetical protein
MGSWQKTFPNSEHKIKDIPAVVQDNLDAIEDAYELEHYSPLSMNTTSGAHQLGIVGIVGEGTTAELTGSSPLSGALSYDTTVGILRRYDGASWNDIGSNYWSRVRAYASSGASVTAGASAQTLIYDTEDYDTLNEYDNATGIFTAKASGYYIVIAQASMVASGTQTDTGITSATGRLGTYSWSPSGAAENYQNIDEYPTAIDTDLNVTQTSGSTDTFSGALPTLPGDSGATYVSVRFRSRRRGCVCNISCYGEGCTCNNTCYGESCTCYNTCYGYSACSCNNTCYAQDGYGGCTCNNTCYGYSACSCNFTCYTFSCTCNATVYGSAGCSCDQVCYSEDTTRPAAVLRKSNTNYFGDTTLLTTAFVDYDQTWANDPTTGLPWTAAGVSGIQGFGYTAAQGTTGCSADISQCYMTLSWYPARPVIGVHIYKNNNLYQSTYCPIKEPGIASYQVGSIFSIIFLSAGDTIKIAYTKTMIDDTLYGASQFTYLAIHRLPVDCL